MTELKPNSPELAYEIDDKETRTNGNDAKIVFKNGSYIKVVTASDSSRGNRAHVLIIDEFRMVKKDVIDTILKKFLSNPRHPKYLDKPEYKHDKSLKEPLKTMYLSSAYYKDHWSYLKSKDSCKFMLDERRKDFVCGFPYQLALHEGLLSEERVIEDMTEADFSEIKWSMEMEALFWGDSDGAFFNFESIAKNRRIQYPMLPDSLSSKLTANTKVRIQPKQNGEKRILSADIALMSSSKHKNDATAIFINQLLPTKAERYSNNTRQFNDIVRAIDKKIEFMLNILSSSAVSKVNEIIAKFSDIAIAGENAFKGIDANTMTKVMQGISKLSNMSEKELATAVVEANREGK